MTREEEQAAVERAQKGDVDAFEALVTANEKLVYSLAFKLLGSRQDAEDASQEAFIKAYSSIGGFRGESRFSVWLYRLTNNICIDMLRRRRGETVSLSGENDEGRELALDIPDVRLSPESELERKELREAVSQGMNSLTYEYRQVLLLREIGGQSYDEIAKSLEIDTGTVKSRIFRARKKLCAILTADGNIFGKNPSDKTEGGAEA